MRRIDRTGKATWAAMAVVAVAALVLSATKARPSPLQNMSGNGLYRHCTPSPNDPLAAASTYLCIGYLTAMLDALSAGTVTGKRACIPSNIDASQMVDVVTSYIKRHPESRHSQAISLVAQAYSVSFPCR